MGRGFGGPRLRCRGDSGPSDLPDCLLLSTPSLILRRFSGASSLLAPPDERRECTPPPSSDWPSSSNTGVPRFVTASSGLSANVSSFAI